MCVGLPMQVLWVEAGHAWVRSARPGPGGEFERRRVSTALVGDVPAGQWLLVFLDAARERIDAARAAEVDAALSMLEDVLAGRSPGADDPMGFALPSAMDAAQLAALTGAPPAGAPLEHEGTTRP